jgi:tRNA(fMet)-specific endonuclease VapC
MARYILDTNIILGYLRRSPFASFVETNYAPFTSPNISAISTITLGELSSFGYRNSWSEERKKKLAEILHKIPRIDIGREEIIEIYGEIQTFSQGKHPTKKLGASSRNTGENDLWIAATTAAAKATLITTDGDFDHLNVLFFPVIKVDPKMK